MARNDILNITDLDGFDSEGFNIPIDFRINDFRNLSSRQGTNSKTIKVPGTKKNDSIFSWRFQLDTEGFYDDNLGTPVTIERENIRLLQGNMQLFRTRTVDGRIVEYEVVVYANNAEWFVNISNKSIKDLDLGSHVYNSTTVSESWTGDSDDRGYVYGLVDYGFFTDKSDTDNIEYERLRPHAYILPMVRQIFKNAGFTFKSDFFTRKELKNLTMLFNQEYIKMIPKGSMRAELTTDIVRIANGDAVYIPINYQDDFNAPNFDTDEAFGVTPNSGGVFWTCPQTGEYRLKSFTNFLNDSPVGYVPDITFQIAVFRNGGVFSQRAGISVAQHENTNNFFELSSEDTISLTAGDTISMQFRSISDHTPYNLIIGKGSYFSMEAVDRVAEGGEVAIADNIPDIKQKDLIKWLFTQFNLVATTDNVSGEVVVEPRDDFYGNIDDADDWSEKVDYLKQIEFTKLTEGLSKTMNLRYKRDELDDNLEDYRAEFLVGYGDHAETLENEFLKGESNITSDLFAATFMGNSFTNTLYMPLMINQEKLLDLEAAAEVEEFTEFENRIAYYNGLQSGDWTYETNASTTYPQMIFIKQDSQLKDVSLAFSNLSDISEAQTRDVGLRDKYYKSLFNNLNFGRLVTLYLKLEPIDILNLDFRKLKYLNINGERKYFILNKIENYVPGSPQTTKVELIEWKPSQSVKQASDEPILTF